MKNKIVACILCIAFLFPLLAWNASAKPSIDEVSRLIDGIFTYQCEKTGTDSVQTLLDEGLSAETDGTQWYLIALSQRENNYDFSAYLTNLSEYTKENTVANAVTRQKYALTFLAGGIKNEFTQVTAADSVGKLGIMSIIFGLHLAANGLVSEEHTVDSILAMLLSRQLADGGFALTGDTANADVTAMAIQALAHEKERGDVALAIEKAVDALASLRGADGHYISYGIANAETTAQVMMALLAVDIDPFTDERFLQSGKTLLDTLTEFRLENGAFSHELDGEANDNATVQSLLALVALERDMAGKMPFYDLDGAKNAVYLSEQATSEEKTIDYRVIVCAILFVIALAVCLILFLLGKRHPKNFFAVLLVLALAVLLVLFVKIERTEDYYGGETPKGAIIGTVTMAIRCDTVAGRADYIPEDGVILPVTTFAIDADDTVYDILTEAAKEHSIPLDKRGADGLYYVAGMAYLYEFAFGDLSGWVYSVNDERASVGCDAYTLSDGDVIVWEYTMEMGKDLE